MPIVITAEVAKQTVLAGWGWYQRKIEQKGNLSFSGQTEAYGILLEEVGELEEAVRENFRVNVLKELYDIFVPCVFEMASSKQRTSNLDIIQGPHRVEVDETQALRIVTMLEGNLVKKKTNTSIHDILGDVTKEFRLLEHLQMMEKDFERALHPLALACLIGIASIELNALDW